MSFSVVWGQNKNENMISYLMVIGLREKHSSFWGKKAVHGTFFFPLKTFLWRDRQNLFSSWVLEQLGSLLNLQHSKVKGSVPGSSSLLTVLSSSLPFLPIFPPFLF